MIRHLPSCGPICRLAMATFLASLDGTIIATALPRIASDFKAQSQMSWVATAYLLTYSMYLLS